MLPSSRTAARLVPVLAIPMMLAACDESKPAAQASPPAPQVTVAKPTKKMVAEHDEYVGRFVAMDYVEVRARVSGYLDEIKFTDGQLVKKGDALFTVDRRPFEATVDQAKAAVQQAEANLSFADSDLKRGESLVRGTVISEQTLDQRTQAKRVAQANVEAQKAATRQAQLDLQFTELTAPVSGRIGDRRVSTGNLVTANTTLLATIASVDPIRFEFTMDEASYLRYTRAASQKSESSANRGLALPAKLKLIDEKDFTHEGRIDFVDNTIDNSSGTIRGRAEFPNPDGKLTPGMFGRIQLTVSAPAEALLLPEAAVGTEQVKKFVFTVGPDNVVQPKYVELGQRLGDLRVITSGITADDTVVVNGLMRVRPGAKVEPQFAPDAAKTAANADHAPKSRTN